MDSLAAVKATVQALEAIGVDYMLVGALSVNAYAVSRSTKDADFVIRPQSGQVGAIMRHLGADFHLDPQLQLETLTNSMRNVVTHLPTDFQIELFRLNVNDEHHQERFRRRRRQYLKAIDCEAWIPLAEDVVIQKVRWQRRKDLDDVVNVLSISASVLDWKYLQQWTKKHGTFATLQGLIKEVPNLPMPVEFSST